MKKPRQIGKATPTVEQRGASIFVRGIAWRPPKVALRRLGGRMTKVGKGALVLRFARRVKASEAFDAMIDGKLNSNMPDATKWFSDEMSALGASIAKGR